MKKIRLFKAHLLIARSIFEKEAPTVDGKSQQISTYEFPWENCQYVLTNKEPQKREREIVSSESKT